MNPELDVIGRQIGVYRVEELIGAGGYSRVYRAVDEKIGRQAAIKILLPAGEDYMSNASVERFEREARIVANLRDPHSVMLYEYGQSPDGLLYMIFEYIAGQTLAEVQRTQFALPAPRAVKILEQVLLSLEEAHAMGLIHRDIKPANIMIYEHIGRTDQVKVLDFGVGKSIVRDPARPRITKTGVLIGTPRYMAPEQWSSDGRISAQTDIYSLGLVAYELLTGKRAVDGVEPLHLMQAHLGPHSFELPGDLDIPQELRDVVNRMMRKPLKERYRSTAEVLQALQSMKSLKTPKKTMAVHDATGSLDPTDTPASYITPERLAISTALLRLKAQAQTHHPPLPPTAQIDSCLLENDHARTVERSPSPKKSRRNIAITSPDALQIPAPEPKTPAPQTNTPRLPPRPRTPQRRPGLAPSLTISLWLIAALLAVGLVGAQLTGFNPLVLFSGSTHLRNTYSPGELPIENAPSTSATSSNTPQRAPEYPVLIVPTHSADYDSPERNSLEYDIAQVDLAAQNAAIHLIRSASARAARRMMNPEKIAKNTGKPPRDLSTPSPHPTKKPAATHRSKTDSPHTAHTAESVERSTPATKREDAENNDNNLTRTTRSADDLKATENAENREDLDKGSAQMTPEIIDDAPSESSETSNIATQPGDADADQNSTKSSPDTYNKFREPRKWTDLPRKQANKPNVLPAN